MVKREECNEPRTDTDGTRIGTWLGLVATILLGLFPCAIHAQEPQADVPAREIFVPFDDLNVILESDTQRVFLTRAEYEALLRAAKAKPAAGPAQPPALLGAEYTVKLAEGRATIAGSVTLETFGDALVAVPLQLAGVGVRSATLDGQPAALGRSGNQVTTLFVPQAGQHTLQLELIAPLQTAAAQQTLQVTLPATAASKLSLAAPGNVEVKGGAAVVSRTFDEQADGTQFELLAPRGPLSLVLSLNNKQLREQAVVVARSVLVDEVTQGYERIHANVSYRVLHGAVERLRLAIPAGFDVTRVEAPQLARWEVNSTDPAQRVLEAVLREPTSDTVVLEISANRSPAMAQDWLATLQEWKFPRLLPLEVAGQVAVVGLLVEDRLQPQQIAAAGLVPIDAAILAGAIPASVFQADPGAPTVRQVVSYYAPGSDYSLAASFVRPAAGLRVTGNSLLVLHDKGQTLIGGFALHPEAEKLFEFRFTAPPGWQVTDVSKADGTVLAIEKYAAGAAGTKILVRLPGGIEAGETTSLRFTAVIVPADWLTEWQSQTVAFPHFIVEGAVRDRGAVAVQVQDDLAARPDKLENLTPLLDTEKASFGLGDLPTTLAYQYESRPFAATLVVTRTAPSITAEVLSFVRLEPDNLIGHYELTYHIRQARTRKLAFSLPATTTPAEIAIGGLDGVAVKEYSGVVDGDRRRWTVQLADRREGDVRLAVDFQQRLAKKEPRGFALPLVQAEDVEYQSAFAAVEGSAELDVQATSTARKVDVGELARADYQVGRRLIGAFGYVGTTGEVQVDVVRREAYALPPALVQRAELLTRVSLSGLTQTVARYDLLTKAALLEIQLPEPQRSTLWTIYLDGQPTKPQRAGDRLLVSLPPTQAIALRRLQIVYETPGQPLALAGEIATRAPTLLLLGEGETELRAVPQADLEWQLIVPTGYGVRRAAGTVFTGELPPHELAAVKVGRFLYKLSGGVGWYSLEKMPVGNSISQAPKGYRADSAAPPESTVQMPDFAFRSEANAPAAAEGMSLPQEAKPSDAPQATPAPAVIAESAPPPTAPPATPAADPFGEKRDLADHTAEPRRTDAAPRIQIQEEEQNRFGVDVGGKESKLWALEGFSSLPIDIYNDTAAPTTTFHSLGAEPRLQVAVVSIHRVHAAAWGMGLLVFLVGLSLTNKPVRRKAGYVLGVLLAATLPLLLTNQLDDVAMVFDYVFIAGCLLIPYYLVAALGLASYRLVERSLARCCGDNPAPATVSTTTVALLLLFAAALNPIATYGQEPPQVIDLKELLPLIEGGPPVKVPADAVVVPYDATRRDGVARAEKLLVPYAKYIELWNRAHPDKKIATAPLPAQYALSGATYQATLREADDLLVTGQMEIEVFGDQPVSLPLFLTGGVLVKATVDGQAARLQLVSPQPVPKNQPAAQQAQPASSGAPLLTLHLTGKGRKKLELVLRLNLERRGGWRVAAARLPAAPATALTLTVPSEQTEIRLSNLPDRSTLETQAAGEKIETALGAAGTFNLQWRPKVAEGQVDQSLTAQSTAVLDVREDALRLVWQLALEFGRGTREAFTLQVPQGYLVEQITGNNIRGWQVKAGGAEAKPDEVEVTLLKPAVGKETLIVHLARRGLVGQKELAQFDAPVVAVEGAALQQGHLAIRRSPRLELRAVATTGLTRADAEGQTAAVEQLSDASDAAVLNVRPFQSFRFLTVPFKLSLSASETPRAATADVQAVLRIAERETTLDARVRIRPQGQPLYQIRLYLPADFELERVAPRDLEWAVTNENGRQLLSVHLLTGKTSDFALTLFGRFAPRANPDQLAVPVLELLDMQRQEGEIAVLPDPDTDVRATDLKNLESIPSMQSLAWLQGQQQNLAKVALQYRSADYSGTLQLTTRLPRVTASSITNVKITPRAIEETLFLNFVVADAGIRELSFLVPDYLAKARIKALLQKQIVISDATTADGQAIPGMKRIRLELQDYVIGPFAVVVEHDRLLTAQKQTAAVPVIETGRTTQRFVAIENIGRDEVVIAGATGVEPLTPQQQAWRELTKYVGNNITQAFIVSDGTAQPQLSFQTQDRALVETAGARIELATTLLMVDEAGAYRGRQEYRLKNDTEQFLEIELPAGARLWTAIVAGEPVKPVELEPKQAGIVRIPLVKTAEGDADYPVELKYGGQMPPLASGKQVRFPLIRTKNVNVQLSQVRLLLPDSYRWFDFDGTLRRVLSEDERESILMSYLYNRTQGAIDALASKNPYTQLRAQANLKGVQALFDSYRSQSSNQLKPLGRNLQQAQEQNEALLREGAEQAAELQAAEQDETATNDNRGRLNYYFENQKVERSKNIVSKFGSNFEADAKGTSEGGEPGKGQNAFNKEWFDQNKLTESLSKKALPLPAKPNAASGPAGQPQSDMSRKAPAPSRVTRGGKPQAADDLEQGSISGKDKAQVELGEYAGGKLQQQDGAKQAADEQRASGFAGGEQQGRRRYSQQLERNNADAKSAYGPQQPGQAQGFGLAPNAPANVSGQQPQRGLPGDSAPNSDRGGLLPGPSGSGSGVLAAGAAREEPAPVDVFVVEPPAGLASLDIRLPERGVAYDFVTPRGELEITARPLAVPLLERLQGLGWLLLAVAAVFLFTRSSVRAALAQLFGSVAGAVLLIVVGLASLLSGFLPLVGLIALIAGTRLAILLAFQARTAAV